ncbi:MAG: DUF1579 family protein [Holophagaceae bacterium]|nr:DUF1579 family protein [Holophagaceae bacterium]
MRRTFLSLVLAQCFAAPLCAQFTPSQKLPQERLDALQRMSMPGTEHSRLARREGAYTTITRHFAAAGAAGSELTGKADLKMILGGRFLQEDYRSDKVGGAEGMRLLAYDGTLKQYQCAWANAGATGLVRLEGSSPDGGATVLLNGTLHDADGEPLSLRFLIREIDADRFLAVLGGDEQGQGPRQEIVYTRLKPAVKPTEKPAEKPIGK